MHLTEEEGEQIWKQYNKQIEIEFPSPKTGGKWRLKPQGWVGQIPLNSQVQLFINPKVSIKNLIAMLNYAYDLQSFHWLEGVVDCEVLSDIYDRLIQLFCDRILTQKRQGFYQT